VASTGTVLARRRTAGKSEWKKLVRTVLCPDAPAGTFANTEGRGVNAVPFADFAADVVIVDAMPSMHAFSWKGVARSNARERGVRPRSGPDDPAYPPADLVTKRDWGDYMMCVARTAMALSARRTAIVYVDRRALVPVFKKAEEAARAEHKRPRTGAAAAAAWTEDTEEAWLPAPGTLPALFDDGAADDTPAPHTTRMWADRDARASAMRWAEDYIRRNINMQPGDRLVLAGWKGTVDDPPMMIWKAGPCEPLRTEPVHGLWTTQGEADKDIPACINKLHDSRGVRRRMRVLAISVDTDLLVDLLMLWDALANTGARLTEEEAAVLRDALPLGEDSRANTLYTPPWDTDRAPLAMVRAVARAAHRHALVEDGLRVLRPARDNPAVPAGARCPVDMVVCLTSAAVGVHAKDAAAAGAPHPAAQPRQAWFRISALGEELERVMGGALDAVPTALAAMFASGFDFTNGFVGITQETVARALIKWRAFIGPLVYRNTLTRFHARLDPDAYMRLVVACFFERYCTDRKGREMLDAVAAQMRAAGGDEELDEPEATDAQMVAAFVRHPDALRALVAERNKKRPAFHLPSRNVLGQEGLRTDLTLTYSGFAATLDPAHNVYLLPDMFRQGFAAEAGGFMLGDTPVRQTGPLPPELAPAGTQWRALAAGHACAGAGAVCLVCARELV